MATPRRSYLIHEGQRWYYRLIKQDEQNHGVNSVSADIAVPRMSSKRGQSRTRSLFEDYPLNTLREHLVVHMTSSEDTRLFTVFPSYIEFGGYQLKYKPENRCFYETILGEYSQKPHFDVDINISENTTINSDEVLDDLIDSIIGILSNVGVTLDLATDMLVFTSHGETKKSYHVVIDHYMHMNNLEARAFYDDVVKDMPDNSSKWVDHAVYSGKQQFRIVGSQKLRSGRPKILNETWLYHGTPVTYRYIETPEDEGYKMILQLEASLVSQTSSCTTLPNFIKADESGNNRKGHQDEYSDDIPKDIAIKALQLLADKAGVSVNDRQFPYRFLSIQGGIICLRRVQPSKCRICNRAHENENPYLLVVGDEMNVYFNCRRSDKNWFVGKLNPGTSGEGESSSHSTSSQLPATSPYSTSSNVVESVNNLARSSAGVAPVKNPYRSTQIQQAHISRILKHLGKTLDWK